MIARLLHILEHLAKQNGVVIEASLNANGICVPATDATLSEIMFNLIRNAIEASQSEPVGKVRIETKSTQEMVVLTVADNGPGIDPVVLQSLYKPFVTGKPTGTGLGLYVASERVRELHGKLLCDSKSGRGTIFRIELPVCKPNVT